MIPNVFHPPGHTQRCTDMLLIHFLYRNVTPPPQCRGVHQMPVQARHFPLCSRSFGFASMSRRSSNARASTAFSSLLAQKSPGIQFPAFRDEYKHHIRGTTRIDSRTFQQRHSPAALSSCLTRNSRPALTERSAQTVCSGAFPLPVPTDSAFSR